jgi:hypothetical protein
VIRLCANIGATDFQVVRLEYRGLVKELLESRMAGENACPTTEGQQLTELVGQATDLSGNSYYNPSRATISSPIASDAVAPGLGAFST